MAGWSICVKNGSRTLWGKEVQVTRLSTAESLVSIMAETWDAADIDAKTITSLLTSEHCWKQHGNKTHSNYTDARHHRLLASAIFQQLYKHCWQSCVVYTNWTLHGKVSMKHLCVKSYVVVCHRYLYEISNITLFFPLKKLNIWEKLSVWVFVLCKNCGGWWSHHHLLPVPCYDAHWHNDSILSPSKRVATFTVPSK